MLKSNELIEQNFLESRCALMEIAAMLDHYEFTADQNAEPKNHAMVECLRRACALLADPAPSSNRAEQLLKLFATV